MKICVLSSGVPHAVPRTLAFSGIFNDVCFVDVSGKADAEKLRLAGIKYYGPADFRLSLLNLQQLLHEIQPDLIICHFCSGPHFFGAIAYGSCPVAGIVMGSDVLYERCDTRVPGLSRLLIRMGLRRMAYISAKSPYLERQCRDLGVKSPIAVNYWGADTQQFTPGDQMAARRSIGLPADRSIVLSPRTLSPLYNIDAIIAAISIVVGKIPDVLLVMIGREAPDYRSRIDNQVRNAGLTDKVKFIGEVEFNQIADYYNASDVVVSMARTEGFPNSVLEVMCCRRPLIIGRIAQIEETIEDDRECRMVEIDAACIAESIVEIISQPDLADRLAANAFEKSREIADIDRNGQVFAVDVMRFIPQHQKRSVLSLWLYRLTFILHSILRKLFRQ